MNRTVWMSVALMVAMASLAWGDENAVPNGNFEEDGGGAPLHWLAAPREAIGESLMWVKEGREGGMAVTIQNLPEGRAPHWIAVGPNLEPGKQYRISAWVRFEADPSSPPKSAPLVKVIQLDAAGQLISHPIPGTTIKKYAQTIVVAKSGQKDWQELTGKFTADKDIKGVLFMCQVGNGFKGVARFDDFTVVPLSDEKPATQPATKPDAK